MPSSRTPPRARTLLLRIAYVLVVALVMLVLLEFAARRIGLGDPILYYNAAWGGMRPLPGQQVVRAGARVTVDAHGYRSARPHAEGALLLLYLGDSVTWGGTRVDDAQVFSEVAAGALRERGRPVYAMNAGVNGAGLVNPAELFLHLEHRVDALVWLFPWGDVERGYNSAGLLWPARHKPRFALVELADHLIMRFWLPAFRESPAPPAEDFRTVEAPPGREAFFEEVLRARRARNLAALRTVVEQARRRGIPVVLGVTPYLSDGALEPLPGEAAAALRELAARGAAVLDLHAELGRAADPAALYQDAVHFTPEGHRLVGQALGRLLAGMAGRTPPVP